MRSQSKLLARLGRNPCWQPLEGLTGQRWHRTLAYHRLQLDILVQALRAELAADARLFETAERTADVERVHVDAVGTGAHTRGDLKPVRNIGGPHRSG